MRHFIVAVTINTKHLPTCQPSVFKLILHSPRVLGFIYFSQPRLNFKPQFPVQNQSDNLRFPVIIHLRPVTCELEHFQSYPLLPLPRPLDLSTASLPCRSPLARPSCGKVSSPQHTHSFPLVNGHFSKSHKPATHTNLHFLCRTLSTDCFPGGVIVSDWGLCCCGPAFNFSKTFKALKMAAHFSQTSKDLQRPYEPCI